MKKGYFYTLGFFLLVSVLIGLAFLISKNSLESKELFSEISVIHGANEIVDSVGEGFGRIIELKAGINIGVSGADVFISEDLPNDNDGDFVVAINDYENFFKSGGKGEDLGVTLDVSTITSTLPFKIIPHNILYTHSNNFGGNVISIDASTDSNDPKFGGYAITVTTTSIIGSCSTSGSTSVVYLKLEGSGSSGSSCSVGSGSNQITIKDNAGNTLAQFIVSNGDLTITAQNKITVRVLFENMDDLAANGKTEVVFDGNVITLDIPDFNIKQETTANIL